MKMPWADKTGLAKALAFFATMLGVSTGLCGVNFLVFTAADTASTSRFEGVLVTMAYLEVLGMAVSAVALVGLAIALVAREVMQSYKDRR